MMRTDRGNALAFLLVLITISILMDIPLVGEPVAERLTTRLSEQARYDREFAAIVDSYE